MTEKRKIIFKSMSSAERVKLIRKKMKEQGLVEGSGVQGKDMTSYDQDEIRDLIKLTSCLSIISNRTKS
tara:strand:- start:1067 stop:1273 length:207 start_codon:yes stop_codon:yes gene_type:complete